VGADVASPRSDIPSYPSDATQVLKGDGTWSKPPGYEYAYTEYTTSPVGPRRLSADGDIWIALRRRQRHALDVPYDDGRRAQVGVLGGADVLVNPAAVVEPDAGWPSRLYYDAATRSVDGRRNGDYVVQTVQIFQRVRSN
jgi:hypothetical protein